MFLLIGLVAGCGGGSSSSSSTASESTTSSEEAGGGETQSASSSSFVAEAEKELALDYKGRFTKPPTEAPEHKSGVNMWLISCGEASQGCSEPIAAAKKAGEKLGWKVTTFDGNFGEGDAYNNGIRQAISAGAEVIITVGVNCDQAKSGYQAAKAANIVVVGADSYDCSDPQVNAGANLMSAETLFTPEFETAGDTSEERGRAKADWIIVHTNGEAKVINTDFAALTGGRYENIGFEEEIKKCTTCEVVKKIEYTPTDTANGVLKQAWASALTQYPEANAGTNTSDGIIIQDGLAQAVQSAGRTKTFALVGGEGYAPNVELIRNENGEDAATPFDSNWLAWGAVDTAIRIMAGQEAVPEGMGVQVIDKEHNLPAEGEQYKAPVNYEALYEKAWGVGG
ncbi:MAG: substrate-binding domain-containing protein [Solirubrobacterales bacterium]